MRTRVWIAATVGLAMLAGSAETAEVTLSGRVVNRDGEAAEGVSVAPHWAFDAGAGPAKPIGGAETDEEGRFELRVREGRGICLLAIGKDGKQGALVSLAGADDAGDELVVELVDLIRVHGTFTCSQLGRAPTWTNVYVMTDTGRPAACSSKDARFSFLLPPGTYRLWMYGADLDNRRQAITLSNDEPDRDLGEVDMPASKLALLKGKPAPEIVYAEARNLPAGTKLADLRGKWVVLEFWTYG